MNDKTPARERTSPQEFAARLHQIYGDDDQRETHLEAARADVTVMDADELRAALAAAIATLADRGRERLDFVDGMGEITDCGCGYPITEWDGAWIHIVNDELAGTDDHEPRP